MYNTGISFDTTTQRCFDIHVSKTGYDFKLLSPQPNVFSFMKEVIPKHGKKLGFSLSWFKFIFHVFAESLHNIFF